MTRRLRLAPSLLLAGSLALGLAACSGVPTTEPSTGVTATGGSRPPSVPTPATSQSSTTSVGHQTPTPASSPPGSATASRTSSPSTAHSSGASTPPASTAPGQRPTPPSACRQVVDQMTARQQAGQVLMMGVNGAPVSDDQLAVMERYQVGSAVLLGSWDGASQVRASTSRLTGLNMAVPVVVAADQEGGSIQRLQGPGLPPIPSARAQGTLTPAQLTSNWTKWGGQMTAVGVRYDLAPVADVVPTDKLTTNEPIGRLGRNYATTSSQAAPLVAGVVTGLDRAGVASSLKHFPGLGQVTSNTDIAAATDTTIARDDAGLAVFRAGIRAGASSVMISSAFYTRIDPDNQAVFSSTVITGMLRGDLGFRGVVISDDLGAAASVQGVPSGQRAVRFVEAGGDLVVNANPQTIGTMSNALVGRAQSSYRFRQRLAQSATRVVELKQSLGLVRCG
ncbi:glycoside hydrolase family 3 N-terminal domain-containing protein [Aestuariimicrobium kwangyangense]|uniref:glycoside hydrolase family 3 N-terminal domain-containing protein n=1 Tax=Aestuariimicrobium kwangyangense TaxID=396389 RepID=UPI0004250444|nr:glycoside hydrolase family 3 N-terminal domain-containing protein [Aestuariimicrobium kwangyangense]